MVFTYSGGVAKGYYNGEYKGQKTLNLDIGTATRNLYIGGECISWADFTGTIDEVRIYDKVLSAEEIYERYQRGL